jgi:acyl-CoA thioester hydrolase
MGNPAEIFELAISVLPADIDNMNHVNNVTYVRWVQDVAVAHWRHGATPAEQERWLWVVIRHEIDYKAPALLGDEIVAKTWVGHARGLKFERHTAIFRASDGALLAKALSLWCSLDAQTKRPTLVTGEIRSRFSVPENESGNLHSR